MGLVGYRTPNIDRIAREGMIFTDYYAEQSCTAGRSSFITGQSVFRTGLSKVGVPGSTVGLQKEDCTLAELLKPHGYATGQFGKNHLGDRDEHCPRTTGSTSSSATSTTSTPRRSRRTPTYPQEPGVQEEVRPAGGNQVHRRREDRPTPARLTVKKRMETIDDEEFTDGRPRLHSTARHKADKPFLCYFNSHADARLRTHLKKAERRSQDRADRPNRVRRTAWSNTTGMVGQSAQEAVDDLKHQRTTPSCVYTTDNGAEVNSPGRTGASTPFKGREGRRTGRAGSACRLCDPLARRHQAG